MSIYSSRPNLMIGFHGCDEAVRDALVNDPNEIKISTKPYDWLGNGFYVWENNYSRALKWAEDKKRRGSLINPSVVGVMYQLEHCLDFSDSKYTDILAQYYESLKYEFREAGDSLPQNKGLPTDEYHDLVIRNLDCAVIEYIHKEIDREIAEDISNKGFSEYKPFDTVRGIFTEGGPAFEGAGIQAKSHIQICIRNFNCIKGFFIPRKETRFPRS